MGNTMCCAPNPKTVRIHQEKGRIMEFYSPILASELMVKHPNHLIVYRCVNGKPGTIKHSPPINSKSVSQNAEVRVVRASTKLELGNAYFLVHIPDQYLARFSKYFNIGKTQVASPATLPRHQTPKLESSAAATAVVLAAGVVGSRNFSSNPRLQKRRAMRPSKSGTKSSRHRRSPRGSPGHKKSSAGRGLWAGEDSANISSPGKVSHEVSQKSAALTSYYQYFRSKYARQHWKPLLETISETDESWQGSC